MYTQKGFTLVEMVVAIGIMAILATVSIASFSRGNKSKKVQLAADSLESAIRTAQDLSLNPKSVATISCADKVPSEYHLLFDSSSSKAVLGVVDKCGNPPLVIANYEILDGVQIRSANGLKIDSNSAGGSGGTIEIEFLPPFGNTKASLNGGSYASFGQATIILESTDSSVSRNIIIDGISGRVETQ